MKHSLIFFLSFSLLLFSCQRRVIDGYLDRVDSLIKKNPDSALVLLDKIDRSSLSLKSVKARYSLLKTKALDLNYIDVADDSIISFAYWYYHRHGNIQEKILSAYYLGVVNENAEDFVNAIWALEEASDLAVTIRDFHHAGLANQHLSEVYANTYDLTKSIEHSIRAIYYFESENNLIYADWSRLDLAKRHIVLKERHQADSIVDFVLRRNSENESIKNSCYRTKAEAALGQLYADFDTAWKYYRLLIKNGRAPRSLKDFEELAIIYQRRGLEDSASLYISIAENKLKTRNDSIAHYYTKASIADLKLDYKTALSYLNSAVALRDSLNTAILRKSVLYNLEQFYRSRYFIQKERSSRQQYIFILFAIGFVFIIASLFFVIHKRNRRILSEMSNSELLAQEIEFLQSRGDLAAEALDIFVKDKVESLRHISDLYFSLDDKTIEKEKNRGEFYIKEDIVRRFHRQLKILREDKDFILSLESSLDLNLNSVISRLSQKSKEEKGHALNEIDRSIITMLLSGFSSKSISFFMNMTESSIRTRKTRYKQYFASHSDKDIQNLALFLDSRRNRMLCNKTKS